MELDDFAIHTVVRTTARVWALRKFCHALCIDHALGIDHVLGIDLAPSIHETRLPLRRATRRGSHRECRQEEKDNTAKHFDWGRTKNDKGGFACWFLNVGYLNQVNRLLMAPFYTATNSGISAGTASKQLAKRWRCPWFVTLIRPKPYLCREKNSTSETCRDCLMLRSIPFLVFWRMKDFLSSRCPLILQSAISTSISRFLHLISWHHCPLLFEINSIFSKTLTLIDIFLAIMSMSWNWNRRCILRIGTVQLTRRHWDAGNK